MIYSILVNKVQMNRLMLNYGIKNFKNHMNIDQKLTLRGLLRRSSRKYPRTFDCIKKLFVIGGVYWTMMFLIPGTDLPLQSTIKIGVLKMTNIVHRMWFYNIFSPSEGEYLIKMNEIILLGMDSQIFDSQYLNKALQQIREVVQDNKKNLRNSNYLDLLLYSEIQLQNIIRYSNRTLLQADIYNHFLWVYSVVLEKLHKSKITNKQEIQVKLFYTIVQYLINFGTSEQLNDVIRKYNKFISNIEGKKQNNDQQDFQFLVAQRAFQESEFLNGLKKRYQQSLDISEKEIIFNIFNELDRLHIENKVKV